MALNFLNNGYFAGKVGIGTQTPLSTLSIKGGSEALRFERDSQETYRVLHGTSGLYFSHPNSGNLLLGLTQNGDITVSNDQSAEYVRFDNSSSNVGIGTTSPDKKLEVSGDIKISGGDYNGLYFENASGTTKTLLYQHASYDALVIKDIVNNADRVTFKNNGNVGIGTTGPTTKLNVSGNIAVSSGSYLSFIDSNLSYNKIGRNTSVGGIQITTGASATMNLLDNGNVGIGTTSPDAKLHIEDTSGANIILNSATGAVKSGIYLTEGATSAPKQVGAYLSYDGSSNKFSIAIGVGVPADKLTIARDTGLLQLNSYGAGTLVSDSSGNITVSSGGGAGGPYLPLDGGTMTGVAGVVFPDAFKLNLGTGSDLQISHDAFDSYINNFTGNLNIVNLADDKDIIFQSDDGSGGVAEYFKIDGQYEVNRFLKNARFNDGVKANFGTVDDLQIYHDGSNSFIQDTGTGDLYVDAAANFFVRNQANGEVWIKGTDSGVSLRYQDSQKLITTNTGVTVTGAATATTFSGDLNGTINTATTGVTQVNAIDNTTIATTAYVNNKIALIPAGLVFQGTWNAATNTPTLTSGSGTTGNFYIVSVAGSTNLDGITDWKVGDWAVFIEQGASDQWEKIDNSSVLDGIGTGQTLPLWAGSGTSNTLTDSNITQDANLITRFGKTATTATAVASINHASNDFLYINGGTAGSAIGDDNQSTRIVFYNNDYIRFDTAGSEKMRILSSGNVGIGTTSPERKLHVQNGSAGTVTSSSEADLVVESSLDTAINILSPDSRQSSLYFGSPSDSIGSQLAWKHSTKLLILGTAVTSGGEVVIKTGNNAEKMRITSTGGISFGSTGTAYGASGEILKSNGNASPTWVAASTVIGGPYLPLIGGTLSGPGNLTVGGTLSVTGITTLNGQANVGSVVPRIDSTFSLGSNTLRFASIYGDGLTITNNATFGGDVNITQTTDVGVLNTTNLDNGSAVGLSLTYPTSNVAAGDGLAIAIGITGRGRSYIANSNTSNNLDASNLEFYTEGGGVINKVLTLDQSKNATFTGDVTISKTGGLDAKLNLSTQGAGGSESLIYFSDLTDGVGRIRYDHNDGSPDEMSFYTASTKRFYINGSGNATFTGTINSGSITSTGIITAATTFKTDSGSMSFFVPNVGQAFEIAQNTGDATFTTQAFATVATSTGDGSSTLTTKGYVDSLITGATIYRGTWDPDVSLNSGYGSPDLSGVTQTSGYYYICSADGAATPNGTGCEPDSWNVGDWVIWNDDVVDCAGTGTGAWQKIDNSSVLSGAGDGQTVALWEGTAGVAGQETLGNAPITISGNNSTFAGNVISKDTIWIQNTAGARWQQLFDGNSFNLRYYNGSSWSADALAISTSNNATFAGNVGIGVTPVSRALQVHGATSVFSTMLVSDSTSGTTGTGGGIGFQSDQGQGVSVLLAAIQGIKENSTAGSQDGALIFVTKSPSPHTLAERMRITSGGNVGIGTDDPDQKLHSYITTGDIYNLIETGSNVSTAGSRYKSSAQEYFAGLQYSVNAAYQIYDITGGAARMTILSGGDVGIGTVSPQSKLHIADNGAATITLSKLDGDQRLELLGGNGGVQMIKSSYDLAIYTGGSERMRVLSTGNVGIGVTGPQSKLQVDGGIQMGDDLTVNTCLAC